MMTRLEFPCAALGPFLSSVFLPRMSAPLPSVDVDAADVAAGSAAASGEVLEAIKQYLLKACPSLLDTDAESWRVGLDSAAAQVRILLASCHAHQHVIDLMTLT